MTSVDLGVAGSVALVVLIALAVLFWLRGRRMAVPGGWRLGGFDLTTGFPRTRGKGYAAADVDDLLDRTYSLSGTEDGRAEALELLHQAQFGLGRGGYDAQVVDMHVDAMIVALQTGRDLPHRPGTPRT